MKKQLQIGLLAAILAFGINTCAMADTFPAGYRVAVVDISAVVAKSAQVQSLKKEQEQKLAELQKWLDSVRADVAKQSTKEGKEKLIKKYDAEFAKKQTAIKKNYTDKLQAINNSISATIMNEAKIRKYDLVLSKGTVLYGGDDITSAITRVVK